MIDTLSKTIYRPLVGHSLLLMAVEYGVYRLFCALLCIVISGGSGTFVCLLVLSFLCF